MEERFSTHNYTVEIACEDPGNFQSRKSLQNLIRGLASELDNKHLNYDIAEFKQQNPTTENLVRYFEQKFLGLPQTPRLRFVKVYEKESLGSEIHYE